MAISVQNPSIPESPVEEIKFFKETDPYGEFSNFYRPGQPIIFEEKEYFTSEHMYHASKYIYLDAPEINRQYIEVIRTINTPYKAKLLANQTKSYRYQWQLNLNAIIDEYQGKGIKSNPDWDTVKDRVMEYVLLCKFRSNSHCREILLSTKQAKLSEASPYDSYWGLGPHGNGQNKLGNLLGKIRDILS